MESTGSYAESLLMLTNDLLSSTWAMHVGELMLDAALVKYLARVAIERAWS